jgi:uncharacterized protein YbjQ (UPF0145 family)
MTPPDPPAPPDRPDPSTLRATKPQFPDLALQALAGGTGDRVPSGDHPGGPTTPGRAPVTTLSVDEAILLDQVGYRPVGTVSGAAVVAVGAFSRLAVPFSANGELTELSEALQHTRRVAVDRLAAAALGAGADGVVGVELDAGDLHGRSLLQVVATGTAVRVGGETPPAGTGGDPSPAGVSAFSAALSGQSVHLLERAGYHPLGIVTGVCVYHVGRQAFARWVGSLRDNREMTLYTEALYDARERAMARLQELALGLGADGVVGVRVDERTGVWGSHVIEFAATGTAVRARTGEHVRLGPALVMDLAAQRQAL